MPRRTKNEQLNDLEVSILQGLKEAVAYKKHGKLKGAVRHSFPMVPDEVDVKAIRTHLGLTQEEFSQFGFSVSAVRHWEQGLRKPEGSARVLLKIIEQHPEIVYEAITAGDMVRSRVR